jgi:geranylgeranyl transferase type-1 subunit beta
LYFLDRLPLPSSQKPDGVVRGITNLPDTLKWLVSRQTVTLDTDDVDTLNDETDTSESCNDAHSFVKLGAFVSTQAESNVKGNPGVHFELQWLGVNGRCNKVADTCYAYWVSAPLKLLGYMDVLEQGPIRKWLLDKTQHMVGGFGKVTGDPPDMYHSFLGLMVLAMFDEPGLQGVDEALCITNRAKKHLESLPWRRNILDKGEQDGLSVGLTGVKAQIET